MNTLNAVQFKSISLPINSKVIEATVHFFVKIKDSVS